MKKFIIFLLVLFNFSFGKAYETFDKEKAFTNNMQLYEVFNLNKSKR